MALISIPTTFNISLEFEKPGFGRRLASFAIDVAVQIFYMWIALNFYTKIVGNSFADKNAGYNNHATWLLLMLPVSVYHLVLEITTNGQSIGKMLTKLRVINTNGGKPAISQFIIRWLLRVSDMWIFLLILMLISFAWAGQGVEMIMIVLFGLAFLFTDIFLVAGSSKGQRIGDLLAHTIVIKTSSKESLDNTIFQEVEETYVPMFPQVMGISDRDLNVVKSILNNAYKSGNFETAGMASAKIKHYLQIESDMEAYMFLERLLKDYNYLSAK